MSLDRERYLKGYQKTLEDAQAWATEDVVLSIHPEWLFKSNSKTKTGPYYDVLKALLEVDQDLDTVSTRKALSVRIARDYREYYKNINPPPSSF
jgi:hypothetical protein